MTAELLVLSNALASDCVAVPQHGPDVCPICRGQRDETEYLCESCTRCESQLSSVHRVLPITLYAKPSAMRDRLRCYKDSEDTSERRRLSREIAALVNRFFREHGDYLAGRYGQWDVACIVPSTTREPPHPLRRALTHHAADVCAPLEVLLRRGSGEIAHRKAKSSRIRASRGSRWTTCAHLGRCAHDWRPIPIGGPRLGSSRRQRSAHCRCGAAHQSGLAT